MSPIERPEAGRPLLILGRAQNAGDLALRRILRAKEPDQALAVVDHQGNLAGLLTPRNKGNLHKGPVLWCDLANRRRVTALFRFQRTPGMKPALAAYLSRCTELLSQSVSMPTIDAVVDLAYRLADQGTIGLAALLKSLQRPEFAVPLRRSRCNGDELDRLMAVLDWSLRFPLVWALSEGNNVVDVRLALAGGGTVWFEMQGAHFERLEHQLVSWMVDAVLMDAFISGIDAKSKAKTAQAAPLVLHGFPTNLPLSMAGVSQHSKQVGVFAFSGDQGPHPAAGSWLDANADCWIAGEVGEVSASAGLNFLNDAERARLKDLTNGEVWVRSGANRKAVTVLARPLVDSISLPGVLRRQAAKRLRQTPVKQFASAVVRESPPAPKNADIYSVLSTKDALFAGWLRIKARNKNSHGVDRVTIEQFGLRLDAELDQLSSELTEGRYRSRPLRTERIPKPDGDVRIIRVACVRDRVVQAACLRLIEPLFEARFSPVSFAYRPGRGAHHAVALARAAIRSGKHHVVCADIRKCFDTIDHEILLRLVGDVIGDRDLIHLLRNWLTTDIIDFMEITPAEVGVPQGEAISPLLANVYLDPMDKAFEQAGATFVRYADDYLVFCESEADAQGKLRLMQEFLQDTLSLSLKPAKTHCGHIAEGVGFLGFHIGLADVRIPQDRVDRALAVVNDRLDIIASIDSPPLERWNAASRLDALIRGFRNYFLVDDAPGVRSQLKEMDNAVARLAGERFAADLAEWEFLWSSREKFLPDSSGEVDQPMVVSDTAGVVGAYAQDDPDFSGVGTAGNWAGTSPARSDASSKVIQKGTPPPSPSPTADETASDPDVLVIDGRLHVMTSGCFVTINGDDLVVRRKKGEIYRTPMTAVTMAYLEGKGIAISADLTMRLCDQGIPVVFAPLVGIPAAVAQPVLSSRSNVRQQQVMRRNEPEVLKAGLDMLAAKVANQASVLKYFARYRKRTGDAAFTDLTRCADELRDISATLDNLDSAAQGVRSSAMGHEGRAAAKYWAAFSRFVPGELPFPGRHTRHATDPVNSAINYVYTMLYGEVWRSILRAGLDPFFGIIHGTERDQGSLVFDLIEEFRAPFGDRLVIGMFGRGFALELDKEGRLRSACRKKLAQAFHKQWHRAVRWRGKLRAPCDVLELQATSLKNAFLGNEVYRPFRFRW